MSAAHERLADLYSRQGWLGDAVVQLRALVAASPRSAHAHTLLARGCVALAADPSLDAKPGPRANGDGATTDAPSAAPRTQAEARALGLIAAIDATKADPNSAEAALALGFALVAADPDGSNRRSSLAAFGKSVLLSPQSADAHLGLGYGLRFFAQFEPSADQRRSELRRAVLSLKSALEIRPSDYQALRELAYCYHQLTDGDNARHVYEMAIAHRGAAPRDAEVAGLYLALADVLIQQSERLQGVARQHCVEAARAYAATAQEITPHLEDASSCLSAAGLSLNPALLQLGNTSGEAVATVPDGRAAVPAPPEEGPQATPRAEKSARAIDVDSFDLSAFPKSPTNFEEQQVMEAIRSASVAAFKADAHARLGRYYERRGDARRAEAERAKAEYWRTAAR
jgi:tetratricopeptide (TPR) repeat protein